MLGAATPSAPLSQGIAPEAGIVLDGELIEASGLITETTTWAADLVRVVGDVEITAQADLTIRPGVRIEFTGFHRILVGGRLWAVGQAHQTIVFTPAVDQQEEGWDGIDFHNIPATRDWSRLEHCILEGAVARADESATNERTFGGTMRPETGGAMSFVNVNKVVVASCELRDNRADFGAAIYVGYGASPILAGNLIHGNTTTLNGSALFNVYAYPKLVNNTIADNTCLDESAFFICGAVENFNGKIALHNNIIRNNRTNHYSAVQAVNAKDYYTWHNNIQAYQGNETNIDQDPGWLGSGAHPYQLSHDSSAIDQAPENFWSAQLAAHDLLGKDRLTGLELDQGAYEYGNLSPVLELEFGPGSLNLVCAPNPFNPRITLAFEMPVAGQANLAVFDISGRRVSQLANQWLNAGPQQFVWNGKDSHGLPAGSGVYLIQLLTKNNRTTEQVVLLR